MKISLSSLSLILLISFVLSQKNVTENPPSDIIPSLTDETFDSALSIHSVLFIEFYILSGKLRAKSFEYTLNILIFKKIKKALYKKNLFVIIIKWGYFKRAERR